MPSLEPRHVCEAEAFKVFPREYHEEVRIVLQTENGKGLPGIKRKNADSVGSYDHGCFQINDYWQLRGKKPGNNNPPSRWWSYDAIFEPNYNARVAKNIWESQNRTWGAWYGPCDRKNPKLPKARCGR